MKADFKNRELEHQLDRINFGNHLLKKVHFIAHILEFIVHIINRSYNEQRFIFNGIPSKWSMNKIYYFVFRISKFIKKYTQFRCRVYTVDSQDAIIRFLHF